MDKKAQKILMNTFWSASGWKKNRDISPEDFNYAKQAGYMFDPINISNSEIIGRAIQVRNSTQLRTVTEAFLASLSTRRLELRSALGSWMLLHDLPMHKCQRVENHCSICKLYLGYHEEDLNVLNFERFKWGGVRHDNVLYGLFDLEQLSKLSVPKPDANDVSVLKDILKAIELVPLSTTSAQLHECFPASLKSNKSERDSFIQILGLCSILETNDHHGYLDEFVPYSKRVEPDRHFVDMCFPVSWWRRSDGVNQKAVKKIFGEYL